MSGSVTSIFSRPRRIIMGGHECLVGEMRLCDMADLQDFLDRRWASPLEALRPALEDMDEAERRARLVAIWDEVEAGPPGWGSEDGQQSFNTGEGILEIIRVALRRYQPWVETQEVEGPDGDPVPKYHAIAARTSPGEYAALKRAFWRVDPVEELERWLEMDPGDRGGTISMSQAVMEVCEVYHWSMEYVESLTMSQFRHARTGGKPRERGTAVRPKTNLKEVVAAARAKFHKVERGAGDG